jgi:hypothetical protein
MNPAEKRRVIDDHAALAHHLFKITIADAVFAIPAEPIFEALNLPFIAEFTPSVFGWNSVRLSLQSYLKEAGISDVPLPIAEERMQGENRMGVAQSGA